MGHSRRHPNDIWHADSSTAATTTPFALVYLGGVWVGSRLFYEALACSATNTKSLVISSPWSQEAFPYYCTTLISATIDRVTSRTLHEPERSEGSARVDEDPILRQPSDAIAIPEGTTPQRND